MKSRALDSFRRKLAASEPLYGLWVTLEAAAVTDIAAGLGLDWVVIDAEHSHLDWAEILEHVRATVRSDTVALVCLSEASPGLIKRALDIGADGVMVPRVETAAQLRSIMRWARHASDHASCWGHRAAQHLQDSNADVMVVPIIETVRSVRNLRSLLKVDGVEVFFLSPADYEVSQGAPLSPEGTAAAPDHDETVRNIRKHGKHAGIVAANEKALAGYRDRGFGVLGLGVDGGIILAGIRDMLAEAGKPVRLESTFAPDRHPVSMPSTGSEDLSR